MANQTLLQAAQYIREHGWTTHTYVGDDGKVCALGAIARVINPDAHFVTIEDGMWGRNQQFDEARFCLEDYVKQIGSSNSRGDVPYWNDYVAKDKEEVILVLETAAKLCDI